MGINEKGELNYPKYNLRIADAGSYKKDQVIKEAMLNPYLKDIVEVSAGQDHSLFLKNNGTVLGSGSLEDGELGLGPNPDMNKIPFKNRMTEITYIDYPISIPTLSNITSIFAGISNSVFLTSNPNKYP